MLFLYKIKIISHDFNEGYTVFLTVLENISEHLILHNYQGKSENLDKLNNVYMHTQS